MRKKGKYKYGVYEKYNGRTTKLKTITVQVYKPTIPKKMTAYLNVKEEYEFGKGSMVGSYGKMTCKVSKSGKKVLKAQFLTDNCFTGINIDPKKLGKAKVDVYDYYNNKCGTVNVTVKKNNVRSITSKKKNGISVSLGKNEYGDDNYVILNDCFKIKTDRSPKGMSNDSYPYEYYYKITSNNPAVFKVEKNGDKYSFDYNGYPVSKGSTTIVVEAGGKKLSIPVVVK